uniref:Uncharacterized protein n=1 Tax=Tanacetum cinerariifolium TaxID=118510 RepID=A0A6L2KHQ0_TANCI|nr:hypothetical protein [Tanacetum cinerariifolium]
MLRLLDNVDKEHFNVVDYIVDEKVVLLNANVVANIVEEKDFHINDKIFDENVVLLNDNVVLLNDYIVDENVFLSNDDVEDVLNDENLLEEGILVDVLVDENVIAEYSDEDVLVYQNVVEEDMLVHSNVVEEDNLEDVIVMIIKLDDDTVDEEGIVQEALIVQKKVHTMFVKVKGWAYWTVDQTRPRNLTELDRSDRTNIFPSPRFMLFLKFGSRSIPVWSYNKPDDYALLNQTGLKTKPDRTDPDQTRPGHFGTVLGLAVWTNSVSVRSDLGRPILVFGP